MKLKSASFSWRDRRQQIDQLDSESFDLLVIGGGASGAACARDAQLRGLKTLLVEAQDFASGTSSGSSKLIHGGIRYLENFEFGLVYSAIQERERLEKLYWPFVRDIDFVFPTFKGKKPSSFMLGLGLLLYDAFSYFQHRHRSLNRSKSIEAFPLLETEGLRSCKIYTDSFAEDYRIVIELIKAAQRNGASCISRMKFLDAQKAEGFFRIKLEDQFTGQIHESNAKRVVNCAGPFSDEVRKMLGLKEVLHLTQGVHFIVHRQALPIEKAFVLSDPENNRILFAIPWGEITYLGTTDTDVRKVEEARAHKDDLNYVLSVSNRYFKRKLSSEDVIQSWAAVRPLIEPESGASNSKISREHEIREEPAGFYHLLGGKLTSHRLMAEELVEKLCQDLKVRSWSRTDRIPLQSELFQKREELTDWEKTYGVYASDIQIYDRSRTKTLGKSSHSIGELLYGIYHECVISPLDFIRRRSTAYYEEPDPSLVDRCLEILKDEMGRNEFNWEKIQRQDKESYDWDQKGYLH